jgi:ABC-type Fe3+-hydroxamate transport system substrate-binding protein
LGPDVGRQRYSSKNSIIKPEEEMKKKSILILAFICIMAFLAACVPQDAEKAGAEDQNSGLPEKDRAGIEISIPDEINRIISISPANTEVLIELGFGDKIIAVDEYSKDIEGLPKGLPLFDMMAPDAKNTDAEGDFSDIALKMKQNHFTTKEVIK